MNIFHVVCWSDSIELKMPIIKFVFEWVKMNGLTG